MVPGAQLCFQSHLHVWATHRGLLLRLPWSTGVHPGEEGVQRHRGGWGRWSPGGDRCVVEPVATGMRELSSVGALPSTQLWV